MAYQTEHSNKMYFMFDRETRRNINKQKFLEEETFNTIEDRVVKEIDQSIFYMSEGIFRGIVSDVIADFCRQQCREDKQMFEEQYRDCVDAFHEVSVVSIMESI